MMGQDQPARRGDPGATPALSRGPKGVQRRQVAPTCSKHREGRNLQHQRGDKNSQEGRSPQQQRPGRQCGGHRL